jgi:hypothetical protein
MSQDQHQIKERFRVYIAIDRELQRLAQQRKELVAQQTDAKTAIEKFLQDHEATEAIEYEGYVAGLDPRHRRVPGQNKRQRVDQAVTFVRENFGGAHSQDPRTAVDRIQTILAGPKEEVRALRIRKPKPAAA